MPELTEPASQFLVRLRDRIDLTHIPFSDRMSRMLVFRRGDSIYIRLAERWEKQQAAVGHYRVRPPILSNLQFTRPDGAAIPFTLTTYPHKLVFDTALGQVQCAFADPETLYFALPAQPIGLRFDVQATQGEADRRGATFHGFRNTACTFNVRLLQRRVAPQEGGNCRAEFLTAGGEGPEGQGPAMLLNISPRLGYNRAVPRCCDVFAEAERRWHDWFAAAPRCCRASNGSITTHGGCFAAG